MKKPGALLGALVAFLLTLPLLGLLFVGFQLAGFPFVPFSVFDNVRDYTPGGVIAFTIQSMVNLISTFNLGRTDVVAKMIEQSMGIGMIVVILLIAGAIFFAFMRRYNRPQEWIPGVIFGLIVGIPLTILSIVGNQTFTADHTTSAVWVLGLFLLWGYAVNGAYNRLAYATTIKVAADAQEKASVQGIDRRQFLITLGGASAAITVVGALVGELGAQAAPRPVATGGSTGTQEAGTEQAALPNESASVQPAPGTRAELTDIADFYRIDIDLDPPSIDLASWTLPWYTTAADGSKTKIAEMTLDDIKKFTPVQAYITQGCISNPIAGDLISTIKWTGAKMQDVLATVKLPSDATHLLITGADGFFETVALDLIKQEPRIILGYEWQDQPLPVPHGFPLRIHIPNLYGMKQPKWITQIDVLNHDVDGYWVVRGWDKTASVQETSVIDTVAVDDIVTKDGNKLVPVGGIAWAGDRGISKVEVSVDGGDWTEAELRTPLSQETWVLWRYDWPFASGSHTFAVRATDGQGTAQITDVRSEAPSGATGIHQVSVTV